MRLLLVHLILLLSFFLLATLGQTHPLSSPQSIDWSGAVVTVQALGVNNQVMKSGPGVYIATSNTILTLKDLIKNAHHIRIRSAQNRYESAYVSPQATENPKLIQLTTTQTRQFGVELSTAACMPRMGEHILTFDETGRQLYSGIVLNNYHLSGNVWITAIALATDKAVIGQPVTNDAGEIIGLIAFQSSAKSSHYFVYPVTSQTDNNVAMDLPASIDIPAEDISADSDSLARQEFFLGLFALSGSNYEQALMHFRKSVAADPLHLEAWFQIGYCANKLKMYDTAIEAFQHYIRFVPTNPEVHYNLGVVYSQLEYYDKAIHSFRKSLELNEKYVKASYNLAVVYNRQQKYKQAVQAFKQTISLKPDYAEAFFGLGLALGHLNKHQQAVDAFQQALAIRPDYVQAMIGLGLIRSNYSEQASSSLSTQQQ